MPLNLDLSPDDGAPVTRRHPRTLVEAFGPDARTACALERPPPGPAAGLGWGGGALLMGALAGLTWLALA